MEVQRTLLLYHILRTVASHQQRIANSKFIASNVGSPGEPFTAVASKVHSGWELLSDAAGRDLKGRSGIRTVARHYRGKLRVRRNGPCEYGMEMSW